MATYMTQVSYTPEHFTALAQAPRDRTEDIRRLCEKLDCKLVGFYYSFGDYDAVVIVEAPDEIAATAVIISAISAGHIRATKTSMLLAPKNAMEAIKRAASARFQAPGGGS